MSKIEIILQTTRYQDGPLIMN